MGVKKITIPIEEYKQMVEICLRYKSLKEYLKSDSLIYKETVCAIMGITGENESD